tara:strand:+ start:40 stop:1356 length:1317 start_codon:yes stop_codon:yes gene_type:complete
MPPQTKSIQDIYKQFELDRLYAGKSSGDGESIIGAMQSQQRLASMPQGGAMQSLTPIGPLDFLAETAFTGASQMEDMNPLVMLLAGALAPGAYKKLKTTNTPALLKKFNVKVDNPLYHNTNVWNAKNILKTGRVSPTNVDKSISLTRNPGYSFVPGTHSSALDTQIIFDKKNISSIKDSKVKPYVYSPRGSARKTELGSPIFGKPSPWFEAEERVFSKKGIPAKNIKAIKIRNTPEGSKVISDKYPGETDLDRLERMRAAHKNDALLSLLKTAGNKKIPVIIEPAAEEGVMGLLDIMNPKQQSKVLKNTKFGGETVTLYRGVKDWHKGKMAKEGKFIGPDSPHWRRQDLYEPSSGALFTTKNIDIGTGYRKGVGGKAGVKPSAESRLLEFEVPKAYIEKFGLNPFKRQIGYPKVMQTGKDMLVFDKGLPTAFLKKVHK